VLPQIVPFDFGDEAINSMDMVSASCTVNKGDTPIDIGWRFNNQSLYTNNGVLVSRTSQRISVLSIESVKHRHTGNYTCIAKNSAGVVQHTAVLHVNG
jgi:Down syndrome cell adhesion molecule-like protein 1